MEIVPLPASHAHFLFRSYILTFVSADRYPRSLSEHPGRNVHGCQLLEKQFRGIWDVDLRDSGLVLARSALETLCGEFPRSC